MRRLFAAAVLIMVALTLAACGDSGTATTGSTAAGAVTPPPAAGAAAANPNIDTHSPTETVSNEPFPSTAKDTPAEVLTRLQNKQPMVLFFFDETQDVTKDQRAEFDTALKKYRGMIDLLSYDINAGGNGSATNKDPEVVKATDMAGRLKVNFTPYIVFVDRAGRVTYRFSGYTDAGMLEREVLRATQ